jgi:2-polyprenyl-3-methyl-5-hydroxy-6-metoxy-1,4-benzoquinol methylase
VSLVNRASFPKCGVCEADDWAPVYDGPVRNGSFGKSAPGAIARCGRCGVDRLAEDVCLDASAYESSTYRQQLDQSHDLAEHFRAHDEFIRFTLETVWPHSMRGKVVADVGCGAGSLLDHLRGLSDTLVAIEPDSGFSPTLVDRGYHWFPSVDDAAERFGSAIDFAFSIQVIEHVEKPSDFLRGIRRLLKPDGMLVLSTPNRNDILMDMLPDEFPSFFYRTQHRWYFDAASLARAAEQAGLKVERTLHVHRYGMANALLWLRDKTPAGRCSIPALDHSADELWRTWLEANGRADNIYLIVRPA